MTADAQATSVRSPRPGAPDDIRAKLPCAGSQGTWSSPVPSIRGHVPTSPAHGGFDAAGVA
jgi:hypothetical protein